MAARSLAPYVTMNSQPNPTARQKDSQCFPVPSAGVAGGWPRRRVVRALKATANDPPEGMEVDPPLVMRYLAVH
jgi:hypothetical protein